MCNKNNTLGGELEGPDKLKTKGLEGQKGMEGDESEGLSDIFQQSGEDAPIVEPVDLEIGGKPSRADASGSDIINNNKSLSQIRKNAEKGRAYEQQEFPKFSNKYDYSVE